MSREALLFLEDIEKSCAKIVRYTEGLGRDQVFVDEMRFDAILFNLHVVGEAVKKLPLDLRDRHPDIAWREIAGLRDFVAPTPTSLSTWTSSGMPSGRTSLRCWSAPRR